MINASNSRKIKAGMIFNIAVGFENLEDVSKGAENATKYSVLLADTILVQSSGGPVMLTNYDLNFSEISYQMDGDEDDDALEGQVPLSFANADGPRTRGSRKDKQDEEAAVAEEKRKAEQKALAKKRQEEALKKYTVEKLDKQFDASKSRQDVICSYKDAGEFPEDAVPNQLYVDVSRESILVPINGQLIPFHIDTVKNVSKHEQGEHTILRINFLTPDMPSGQKGLPAYADKNCIYIRELSFRSLDGRNLTKTLRLIKELQKRIRQREIDFATDSTMVAQETLVLNRDKKAVPRLRGVQIRPKVSGKKSGGMMEAHLNGLRFISEKGAVVGMIGFYFLSQALPQMSHTPISSMDFSSPARELSTCCYIYNSSIQLLLLTRERMYI